MSEIGNMPKQGKKRGNPAWVKGGASPNPTGRPGGYEEFRALCKAKTPEAVEALVAALGNGDASGVAAARVLLEYAWGKPASAPEDLSAMAKGVALPAGLTVDQVLAIARGEKP